MARAQFVKQSNQRIAPRPAIQPQRNRRILRIVPGLEEPEEGVRVGGEIDVARVRFDARGGLADALFAGLFVADGDVVGGGDGLHAGWIGGNLGFGGGEGEGRGG